MAHRVRRILSALILVSAVCIGVTAVSADPSQAPAQAVAPFLYPPYPGSASQNSIFDHTSPNYTNTDNRIVVFSGKEARKNCPSPQPAGTPPPGGICDAGNGAYWSYSIGDWVYYNGHDGIDFGISYRPVYAAADADRVEYAGWWDPQNHSSSLGIYVRLHHPNGYRTLYGHMSSVAVQTCPSQCPFLPHGEVLGVSGTTGNSTGPHLHLQVQDPLSRSVDPYGWTGSGADPLAYNQPESLWVSLPALVYYGGVILPSGDPLAAPPPVTGGILVDDSSSGFDETPAGCWTQTTSGSATNATMRYIKAKSGAPTCTATWGFPAGNTAGIYSVYVRIPAVHGTTQGAMYIVHHAGKDEFVTTNQEVFPNNFVPDGWVYIGKYQFTGDGT
ncbi:MAG TPA: peptidoglycan DD-metalloendopeptidase family protein, partial [Anaerolineales bacterium]